MTPPFPFFFLAIMTERSPDPKLFAIAYRRGAAVIPMDFKMQPITYGNILAVFFAASDLETINGSAWYVTAKDAAATMAQRYSLSADTVAAVIAALSPNNRWQRNLRDADNLIRVYILGGYSDAVEVKTSTYGANKTKALKILEGAAPLEVLGGLKVKAFYGCIMGQDAVCIDGHAYSIWRGERISISSTPKISAKLYDSIVADYIRATDTINNVLGGQYQPSQVQAITWLTWRRLSSGGSYDI
jgi:hypothetical protein